MTVANHSFEPLSYSFFFLFCSSLTYLLLKVKCMQYGVCNWEMKYHLWTLIIFTNIYDTAFRMCEHLRIIELLDILFKRFMVFSVCTRLLIYRWSGLLYRNDSNDYDEDWEDDFSCFTFYRNIGNWIFLSSYLKVMEWLKFWVDMNARYSKK